MGLFNDNNCPNCPQQVFPRQVMTVKSLLFCFWTTFECIGASLFDVGVKKCQPIEIPLCKNIPYNYTFYPTPFGHIDQQSTMPQAEHFQPLIRTKCSAHIQFFVCSFFAPMCPETMPRALTSCQSVCQQVKRDCLSILEQFAIGWPEHLNCSRFPQPPELCMKPTDAEDSWASDNSASSPPDRPVATRESRGCRLFSDRDRNWAALWMLIWAPLCLLSTAATCATYLLNRSRFPYPERPVFYLSACCHLYAWAFIIQLIFGHDQQPVPSVPCQRLQLSSHLNNPKCVIVFLILHYFGTSTNIWWILLTVCWYLSARRKWSAEGIDAYSSYLHLIAWGLPAILSLSILIMHKMDVSEVTGLCSVGNGDPMALLVWDIVPRVTAVLLGCVFIFVGLVSVRDVRANLRSQGKPIATFDKLIWKLIIFAISFTVPAISRVLCSSYHALLLVQLQRQTYNCDRDGRRDVLCLPSNVSPRVEVYMLDVFMSLIVGTSTGLWVLSRKTFLSWIDCIRCRLFTAANVKQSNIALVPVNRQSLPLLDRPTNPLVYQHQPALAWTSAKTNVSSERSKFI